MCIFNHVVVLRRIQSRNLSRGFNNSATWRKAGYNPTLFHYGRDRDATDSSYLRISKEAYGRFRELFSILKVTSMSSCLQPLTSQRDRILRQERTPQFHFAYSASRTSPVN
jgi:hypothetical protein